MPWNDNSKSGPWGAPQPSEGDRPNPADEPPRAGKDAAPARDSEKKARGPWDGDGPRLAPRRRAPDAKAPKRSTPPPPRGPDMDELSHQLRARLIHAVGGSEGKGVKPSMIGAAIAVVALGWAATGFYVVDPDQQGMVTHFGAYVGRAGPGLNYHFPSPIERVIKVQVGALNRTEIGGAGEDGDADALTPTGDGQLADLDYAVQWRVDDVTRYLFHLSDPRGAVGTAVESAMREVVGRTSFQDVLTTGRGRVEAQAAARAQQALDREGAGISIVAVRLNTVGVPAEVLPAARDVAAARQDAQTAATEANAYRDRVLTEAKGEAARAIQAAQGYSGQVVRQAQGEAARFTAIDAAYKTAPLVTRQRLYIETMERVLRASNKVVVDTPKTGGSIVLPPELFRHHATPDQNPPPTEGAAARQPSTPQTQAGAVPPTSEGAP